MKTTCPHCRQPIEIDAESADALKAVDSFECPTCAGAVPVPKAPPEPAPERPQALPPQLKDPLPNGLLAAFGRMNRTMCVLGVLVLLVIGGLAIFLATRKPGDTFNVDRTIRDQIIHNDFFTRLIASGETTEEELKKVQAFEPYGNGYIGLSEEGWTWSESRQLAQRTAAEVVDVAVLAQDGRKQLGAFLAEKFPFAVGRAVWVGDAGAPKLIDSPDLLDTKDRDRRHHVFLSWPKSGDWQNHGWSWVIPAEYDEAQPFSEWGLAAVRVGKQWGLINESGQFVLPPQFDLVEKFSDQGCARVQVGEAWGLVNRRGELATKVEWEDVQDQVNGFTPVKKDGKWGYLNAGGTLVIPCDWEDAWRFSPEGFAVVTRAGKRGIIDHGGKVIVEPEWDGAINFDQHGLGLVRRGESWALIDSTGKLLTEPVLKTQWKDRRWDLGVLPVEGGLIGMDGKAVTGDRADRLMAMMNAKTPVSEGLKRVETEQGTGFIDQMGEWGIPPREGRYRDFADGLAAFEEGRHWGFIDRSGQAVIKPEWDEVGDFSEGMAAVKREKKWGAVDAQGQVVTSPVWDEIRSFHEGLAAVRQGKLWGFLDHAGKIIADPKWPVVGDFSEGIASVKVDPPAKAFIPKTGEYDFWSFIDRTGNLLFGGRAEMIERGASPSSFKDGVTTISASYYFKTIDTQGRVLNFPNGLAFITSAMTRLARHGLVLKPDYRNSNYLNRNGDHYRGGSLVYRYRSLVLPEVNGRADWLGDFVPYASPPKYGLIDLTGKVLVPPTWDEARVLSPDWVKFRVGDKCGLADKTGRIHIPPTWSSLDILRVRSGSLGEDGKSVTIGWWNGGGEPIFSPWIEAYGGGRVILQTNGVPAIPNTMKGAKYVDFYDSKQIVITEPDPQGGILLSLYEPATGQKQTFPTAAKLRWNWNTASEGFIWLQDKTTQRWHLRGQKGEDYGHSQPAEEKPEGWGFVEGRGRLHDASGWFHIGTDGKPISTERWEEANEFAEGRAAVKRNGVWGFIGLDGNLVTEMAYEEANDFSRGLAAVKVGGRWGFIDLTGEMTIAPVWDEVVSPASDQVAGFYRWYGEPGLEGTPGEAPYLEVAQVKINGSAALIGRDGGLIIDPRLPNLTKDGAAYLNGDEQVIVMRRGSGVELVRRDWPAPPDWGGGGTLPIEVSPARQWRVRDEELARVLKLRSNETAAGSISSASLRSLREQQGYWGDALDTVKWTLVDETAKSISEGNWINPKTNRTADPFSDGLIHARGGNEKYGLIRKDGTTVLEPQFDSIHWVAPKIAVVWNRDEGGLITAEGKWLFQDNDAARIARFVRPTNDQFRYGLAVIEDVPKWGYARLNRSPKTPDAP